MTSKKRKKKVNSRESRTCAHCDEKFNTKIALYDHIKAVHEVQQASTSADYAGLYWQAKHTIDKMQFENKKLQDARITAITNWIDSIAKMNQAVSQAIGEGADRRL